MLSDHRVLVTGGSRGIGRAIAEECLAEGARVSISCRSAPPREPEGVESVIEADLSTGAGVRQTIDEAARALGGLDTLINNAGIGSPRSIDEESAVAWAEVIAVNLTAPFQLVQRALPHLRRSRVASIVNVGSVVGLRAVPGLAAYAAAKGGLHQLTSQLALDLARDGIRVNCVAPGFVRTEMFKRNQSSERRSAIARRHPLGRVSEGREVARAVTFLASESASFVTGACLQIDGGLAVQVGL